MKDKPDSCYESGCPLANKARGFVLGVGDPTRTSLAFNLEAPGKDEVDFMLEPYAGREFLATQAEVNAEIATRKRDYPDLPEKFLRFGVPIVGKSGAQIGQWVLPAAGLQRRDIFIDNTLRCLPPKVKDKNYPTGEDRKLAEKCCRHYDRWDKFKPDVQLVTIHPAGILREVTPLPLQIKDFEKARDFVASGLKVMMLIGGKAFKAFMGFSENVTKLRGHYQWLGKNWAQEYKTGFEFVGKKKKSPKEAPVRPIELNPDACKSFKRYKGKRPPKCGCEPCWKKFEEVQNEKIPNQSSDSKGSGNVA